MIESQLKLRENEKILSSLIEQARTPIFIVQDGIIRFANPALFETFGYLLEEVIGTENFKYVPEKNRRRIIDLYQKRLQGSWVFGKLEFSILHKNHRQVEVDLDLNFIEYEGKPDEIVLAHDITERKRIEANLKRL